MMTCARCGALPGPADAACRYCGAPLEGRGELLSAPDFRLLEWPGWMPYRQVARFSSNPGPPPELVVDHAYEGPARTASVIASNGSFADVDVAVSIRFAAPPGKSQEGGVKLRASNSSHYYVKVTSTGLAAIEFCDRVANQASLLVPWARAFAGAGPTDRVRLRVVLRGTDFRLWVNSTLTATARHPLVSSGQVHLAVSQLGGAAQAAFSDLVLREPDAAR